MEIKKSAKKLYLSVIAGLSSAFGKAKDARLLHLSPKTNGASCGTCHYWKDTGDPLVGYCFNPEVSVFVTKKQVCNQWVVDGTLQSWDNTRPRMLGDFKDFPPNPDDTIDPDRNGGIEYKEAKALKRATNAGVRSMPDDVGGAVCANCQYSRSPGWCLNKKVDQPIDGHDWCKEWDHPKVVSIKKN